MPLQEVWIANAAVAYWKLIKPDFNLAPFSALVRQPNQFLEAMLPGAAQHLIRLLRVPQCPPAVKSWFQIGGYGEIPLEDYIKAATES